MKAILLSDPRLKHIHNSLGFKRAVGFISKSKYSHKLIRKICNSTKIIYQLISKYGFIDLFLVIVMQYLYQNSALIENVLNSN